MIKSLRRRLACLLICAIGATLILASGAALLVSEHQLALRELTAFQARLTVLTQDVRMERSVSGSALAKAEAADRLVLTIYDNGQAIDFHGGWQPATPRSALFARTIEAAERAGVSLSAVPEARFEGTLRGDKGERYLAAVQTIGGYRTRRAVVMLQDMRAQDAQRTAQRLLFGVITLCAVAAMSAFCWLFTARAVRPIAQAHAQQNAFVAAASHELRTPLQVMQSGLDALKESPEDPSRFTGAMQRELTRMGRLSEDLMILTAADEAADAQYGPVELAELAEDAVRDHLGPAAAKSIALQFIPPASPLPLIEGDAPMLRRAVNVLIDNAICYTQAGGHVAVSICAEPKHLHLRVQDDGPGIAPEHRPHIFERFYRADHPRTDRAHSGLGLCIAKQIAEQHRGRLRYEPVTPHGCRFTMSLPRIAK